MGKDGSKSNSKPTTKTGKVGTKSTGKSAGKSGSKSNRRSVVQIQGVSLKQRISDWIANPVLVWGALAYALFIFVVGTTMLWSRGQTKVAVGQIMRDTRSSRVEFNTEDVQQTQMQREAARLNVPRVYSADMPALEEIAADLIKLPKTLGGVSKFDEVSRDIRVRFGLKEESFEAIGQIANDEAKLTLWTTQVRALNDILKRRPLLNRQAWQSATQEGLNTQIELRFASTIVEVPTAIPPHQLISRDDAINIDKADQFAAEISRIIRIAGFEEPTNEIVLRRLVGVPREYEPRPTFAYDGTATAKEMDLAASHILPVRRSITIGQRIYSRGDVLEQASYALAKRENQEYSAKGASVLRKSLRSISIYGIVAALGLLLGGYTTQYCPKIARKPARILWMTGLITSAIVIACVLSVLDPRLIWLSSITPIVLLGVLVSIAYDQRTGLALTGVAALIVTMSLQVHIGLLSLMLIGIAGAIAQLGDLRERRTLIHMSIIVAISLSIVAMLDQLINLPTIGAGPDVVFGAILGAGAQSFIAGLLVGGISLFILPFIERAFDITTGMTLIELRDPKQPVLRELQQRAPGTYNHSLNVASIAESAAESIGADALLTYVGCLYHDIGKMNKPMYFIENQSGGPNKHDKLTPAMSLLVIVGHVKDGVEMAREHGLPKSLHHFIEAHHGTTLVEYFYRRAREQASQSGESRSPEQIMQETVDQLPDEVDYRYPGPRPQTKEVAIVMLSDAVESATRTLTDPTPSRIDALVRQLANKRLMDGQFDECDLTFRELSTICESISKTVASIYHGRIRYSSDEKSADQSKKPRTAVAKPKDPPKDKPKDEDKPDSDTPPARSA